MIVQGKITSKRQITLPIKIMRKLGLNPGDAIAFEDKNDHIEIVLVNQKFSALDLSKKFGKMNKIKLTQTKLNEAREKAWGSRYEKHPKDNPSQ